MLREKFTENSVYSQFFSFEVLNYFDSLATDENYEWIEKYFDVLMRRENKIAEKFNDHHIRPAFTFRDNNHKNRKETKSLANEVNGNIIKLSIQNHIKAHNCLRFIFKNTIYEGYARSAIYVVCRKRNIENFTENEIDEIAKIIEECSKENKTKDEIYEFVLKSKLNYRINNHESIAEYNSDYKLSPCFDPINNDYCTQHTLEARIYRHKDLYKNITVKDCLIKNEELKEKLINEFKKSKIDLEKERWEIIQNSNINFQKCGWGTELSKLFGIPRNDCGIYIKRHFPQFYKTCYIEKRK